MRPPRPKPVVAVLLAAVLVATTAGGADRPTPAPPGAPLLWRVERNGRTSYLFGTVHVGLDLDAALGEAGRSALDGASRVFVEIDITEPATVADMAQVAAARALLPPGGSLRALLKPASWERLVTLQEGHLSPAVLDRMEPWFAALSTFPRVAGQRPTTSAARPSLDAAIAARAAARGTKVMALETPLQQVRALAGGGREEGVAMLEQLLAARASAQDELNGLVGAYASNDDRRLLKAFAHLARKRPALAEHVLFRRNERWCERLDLWLSDGGMFVAVGAFHMFGERGLVNLLRERGYRVERVRDAAPV